MEKNSMCSNSDCYNDKEYGNTITYNTNKQGNERFYAKLLDLCILCRVEKG